MTFAPDHDGQRPWGPPVARTTLTSWGPGPEAERPRPATRHEGDLMGPDPGRPVVSPTPPGHVPPPPPQAPATPFLSTTKGVLTVLGTLVAIVGTVVTTWFAVQDRPAAYRLADWSQAANAVCDRERAAVSTEFGAVDTAIQQALSGPRPDPEVAAQELEAAPGYYRKLLGSLRALRLPAQDRDEIAAAFAVADGLDERYYDVADLVRRLDPADLAAEPLRTQLLEAFDRVDQQWSDLAEAWRALGATSCALTPQ